MASFYDWLSNTRNLLNMKKLFFLSILTLLMISCKKHEKRYVRKNIHSVEARKDVEALDKALKIMREKNCSDPLSWYYQGSIHWIPDTINNNLLCDSYKNVSDLKDAWDNCTHTPQGQEVLHFLVWHRMYIYHFEKIIRKLSGYDDFALPYWAYTNNDKEDKTLQETFRNASSSLYENARFDSLNMGYPVSGEIERALDLTKLFKSTSYETFCINIDKAPHGAMHDYIGAGNDTTGLLKFDNKITNSVTSTGLMGWVPTAGFDPVFWTHHSNIDRLWQQWTNSENGKNVTIDDLNKTPWPYEFFDENGKKVTYSLEEVLKVIYDLDYNFDDTKVQPKENPKETIVRSKKFETKKLSQKLTSNKTEVNLGQKELFLGDKVLITVSFLNVPKGSYEVYLSLDNDPHPSDEGFLGFMTFFGADHKVQGKTCQRGCCGNLVEGRRRQTFTFEVTDKPKDKNLKIVILKNNNNVHKDLIIENVEFH